MTDPDFVPRGCILPDDQEPLDRTNRNERQENEREQQPQPPEWVSDPRHLTAIFTGAIALLTAFYVLVTFSQFSLMRDQLQVAHRARIFVLFPDPVPPIEVGKPTPIRLELENTGSLPAIVNDASASPRALLCHCCGRS